MSIKSEDSTDRAGQLSALMDGELEPDLLPGLCGQWRDDGALRARWHSYQLIGDVLRSEDLASTAAHDAAFLARLRVQLASEPVVLAPQALPVARPLPSMGKARLRRSWRSSAAVAAGFVVVAVGAVNMLRPDPMSTESASVALRSPAPAVLSVPAQEPVPAVASAGQARDPALAPPTTLLLNGTLIRDARLDEYLAAHQQLSGGSLLGGHAAFLRQAVTDAPRR